jgi:hypothetical protein
MVDKAAPFWPGRAGSPNHGSYAGAVSADTRIASTSPTLGRIGAPQPSR